MGVVASRAFEVRPECALAAHHDDGVLFHDRSCSGRKKWISWCAGRPCSTLTHSRFAASRCRQQSMHPLFGVCATRVCARVLCRSRRVTRATRASLAQSNSSGRYKRQRSSPPGAVANASRRTGCSRALRGRQARSSALLLRQASVRGASALCCVRLTRGGHSDRIPIKGLGDMGLVITREIDSERCGAMSCIPPSAVGPTLAHPGPERCAGYPLRTRASTTCCCPSTPPRRRCAPSSWQRWPIRRDLACSRRGAASLASGERGVCMRASTFVNTDGFG
jgi:hypothetical protein